MVDDIIIDSPDDRDYMFEDYIEQEEADWQSMRPLDNFKLFDQWKNTKCTWYALQHIVNLYNLKEDLEETGGIIRQQLDPDTYEDNRPHTLQDRLKQFRELWLIEWYVTIPRVWYNTPTGIMTLERRNKELNLALNKWFLIYTGSDKIKWTMNNWPIVKFSDKWDWHAFPIITNKDIYHSTDNLYKFGNSFGSDRGDNGYWYIQEKDVDKLFTAYIIIDKSDSEYFKKYRANKKVFEFLQKAKELYNEWNDEIKKYFEQIKLSENLTKLFKM